MKERSVLPNLCAPTEAAYDEAVRKVILGLSERYSHKEIAQCVGVTPKTIYNAQEKHYSLKGWVVPRNEWVFGTEAVRPIIDLAGGGRVPPDPLADIIRDHVKALNEALTEADTDRLLRVRA